MMATREEIEDKAPSCSEDGCDDPDCGRVGAGVRPAIRSAIRDKKIDDLSLA